MKLEMIPGRMFTVLPVLAVMALPSVAQAADAGIRLYEDVPKEIETLHNPYKRYEPEAIKRGEKLYRKNCAVCHGMKGDARGPISRTQKTKPTSFLKIEYMALHLDSHLFYAVREGSQGTSMPAFKGTLKEDEIWALISYIRHFSEK